MGESSRLAGAVRYFDLALLAAALPLFVLFDWPLLAYAVIAVIWVVQLGMEIYGQRTAVSKLAAGDRRAAMGWVAASTLGRVWLVALAVLLIGLLDERDTGLAAAVLAAVLFTVHFVGRFIARALDPAAGELG